MAEAENAASGKAVGEGLAKSAHERVRSYRAEVYMGVVKVSLDGADGEAVVEERKNVIDADAACDAPSPFTMLKGRAAQPGCTDESMGKWNEAIFLVTKDGTGFRCVDGVIRAVTRKVTFDLDTQKSVEV